MFDADPIVHSAQSASVLLEQRMQPENSLNFPAPQRRHVLIPENEYTPGAHRLQLRLLGLEVKLPSGQGGQSAVLPWPDEYFPG